MSSLLNPFEIPLVVDLIFNHLEPPHLLNCREVNHAWNEGATRQLMAKGWAVKLNTAERGLEYLQLIKAVAKTKTGVESTLPLMDLHLSSVVKHPGVTATNKNFIVLVSTKINKRLRSILRIKSITCDLAAFGIHHEFWNLLRLVSSTLTHITFVLQDSPPVPVAPPVTPSPAAEIADRQNQPKLELELGHLRTLCFDFSTRSGNSISIRPTQVESLRTLLAAAPNLEHIQCTRNALSHQDAAPFFLLQGDLPLVVADPSLSPHWIQNLIELEVVSQEMFGQLPFLQFRFPQLRRLKISSPDTGDDAPSVTAIRFRQFALLQFIRDGCPMLDSLELTELDNFRGPRQPGAAEWHLDELQRLEVLQVTRYGYKTKQTPFSESGIVPKSANTSTIGVLCAMKRLPSLREVSVNLEILVLLRKVYARAESLLAHDGLPLRWPGVSKLTIDVAHATVPLPETGLDSKLQAVVTAIKTIFPNLEQLVINLGADRVSWKVTSNFAFVLQLVFGIDSLRRVEIHNFYNTWTLPQVPTLYPDAEIADIDEDEAEQELPAPMPARLEAIVIRGVRPSFVNSHVDCSAFPPPRLDLLRLQELIPVAIRSELVLEIDGDLLWNCELYSSYDQLIQQTSSLRRPRVRLA